MKLIDLINLAQPLQNLMDQSLSFAVAYKVSKIIKIVSENDEFYRTKLKTLLDTYKDEQNSTEESVMILEDKKQEFIDQLNELQQIEVDTEIPKLTAAELETTTLTPKEALALTIIIE